MDSEKIKKQIKDTFNDVSGRYDENRFFKLSAQKLIDFIPDIHDMRILDVSTGTGNAAIEISKKHPTAKIEAVDLANGMLQQAKIKAESDGLRNISFTQLDVETLPYDDSTFDIITCGYAMFFYTEMESSYLQFCRKIRDGGRFIFSSFTEDAFNPYSDLFLQRLKKDYQLEIQGISREKLNTVEQINNLVILSTPGDIQIEKHKIRYPITTNDWWSLLNSAGYKGLLDQLTNEQLQTFKHKHLEEIEGIANAGFIELNADTLFGVVTI